MSAKVTLGRCGLSGMRPLFRWRGRIVSRHFGKRSRFYDSAVRRAIEALADVFEGWVLAPDLARMEAMIAENERIAREIADVCRRFGLDDAARGAAAAKAGGEGGGE